MSRPDWSTGGDESRAAIDLRGEAILPLPGPRKSIPAATAYRSTWVVSSLECLRHQGHMARYEKALRSHRDEILSCVAGVWMPMTVVRAHYEACDALGLTDREITEMTRGTGSHVRRAWHASMISAAEQAAQTGAIWAVMAQLQRSWSRSANGGATAVYRLGENRARVEYVGCELFEVPYYRASVRAVLRTLVTHFASTVSVEDTGLRAAGEGEYLMQWVQTDSC